MMLSHGIVPTLTGYAAERPTILAPFCLNGWQRNGIAAVYSPISCNVSAIKPSLNVRERNENGIGNQPYMAGQGHRDLSDFNKDIQQHPSWFRRRRP